MKPLYDSIVHAELVVRSHPNATKRAEAWGWLDAVRHYHPLPFLLNEPDMTSAYETGWLHGSYDRDLLNNNNSG